MYLLISRVRSIEQTSSRMSLLFHISPRFQLDFLQICRMQVVVPFRVSLSHAKVPRRLPNVSPVRLHLEPKESFAALLTLSSIRPPRFLLHSPHGFLKPKWGRNLQHFSTDDVNFTLEKVGIFETTTVAKMTQKCSSCTCRNVGTWHLQCLQSVAYNKHVDLGKVFGCIL